MKTMLNLLPQNCKHQQVLRNRAVQWGTVIAVVLAAGWVLHWIERQETVALTHELALLTREHEPTKVMLRELTAMRKQLGELQQQEVTASELESQRNALTLLGAVSHATELTAGRVQLTKLDLHGFQNLNQSTGTEPGGEQAGMLLSGVSLDNAAVGEMLEGLQQTGLFKEVVLKSLKEREEDASAMRDYELHCEF